MVRLSHLGFSVPPEMDHPVLLLLLLATTKYSTQNITTTTLLWQTNVSAAGEEENSFSYSARLLDSGNLVMLHADDTNGSVVAVWQSFDYPTHIMLPNMKIGLDRRTGLNEYLTSWESRDDPGTGEYFYRIDPCGSPQQAFLLKGMTRRWRTGPWFGGKWIGIPEMPFSFIYNVSYVDNNEELSVMYGPINASIMSIMFLDEFGFLQGTMWHEDC